MKEKEKKYTTISLNIPNDLFNEYTEMARKSGIPRTNYIIIAMREYLKQTKAIELLPDMLHELKLSRNSNSKK